MRPLTGIAAAIVLVASVLLQVTIVQRIELGDASLDLVVLVVVSIALLTGPISGSVHGFGAGVLLAVAAAIPLGPHALLGAIVGYGTGRWGETLVTDEHPAPPVIAGLVGTLAMQVGVPLVDFLVNPAVVSSSGILAGATITVLLGGAAAVPVYLGVRRLLLAAARFDDARTERASRCGAREGAR